MPLKDQWGLDQWGQSHSLMNLTSLILERHIVVMGIRCRECFHFSRQCFC